MWIKCISVLIVFGSFLVSCGDATSQEITPSPEQIDSFQTYCFKRVGQIGTEPRRGEACSVDGHGSGGYMADLDRPERNNVSVSISAPSLVAIGVKFFSFTDFTFGADPKFSTGVEEMDQVRIEWWEVTDLPDQMGMVSDVTGKESIFSHTSPDAAHIRDQVGGQVDLPGYEIASALLSIDRVVEIPLKKFEAKFSRQAGMVMGRQYIEGTLKFSLIPMGSKGEQFGPTTFEFGTTIEWGYSKK